MRILRLRPESVADCAARAAEVLRAGGIILYPTDTVYGLGADAFSGTAVEKIYRIKGRDERKPIHAIAGDLEVVEQYAEVGDEARLLAKEFWPGALTLVLRKRASTRGGIARGMETIGFRIPNDDFCRALAREFGGPVTTTSANRAGEKPERSVLKILNQLGESAQGIDLVIDAGALAKRQPSTVVDMSAAHPVILREGAIPAEDIWNTIRAEP